MFARLWWKDMRFFWPLWLFVAGAGAVGQWLTLWLFGQDARTGALGAMAVGWAGLYGFAVAAAAFAGEREGGTLRFLDTLSVGRGRLWGGKASFALASTLALAALLVGLAALSTERWETGHSGFPAVALASVSLLLEAIGWGLFWSAVSGSALVAAALAVCSMGIASVINQHGVWLGPENLAETATIRMALALTATVFSLVVVNWPMGRRIAQFGFPRDSNPRPGILSVEGRERPSSAPLRSFRISAASSLVWQTVREAFPLWWRILALNLGVIVASYLSLVTRTVPEATISLLLPLNLGAFLIAGVSVFGREGRTPTRRFLVHHGVCPVLAWPIKVLVWAVALAPIWLIVAAIYLAFLAFSLATLDVRGVEPQQTVAGGIALYAGMLAIAFALGLLCGMTLRRGITAGLVATVLLAAVSLPAVTLHNLRMLPDWGAFLICPTLLAVGWAWSRDWMLDRPGFARWARLALLLVAASGLLFAGYVAYRIDSVPEVGTLQDLARGRHAEASGDVATGREDPAFITTEGALTRPPSVGVDLSGGNILAKDYPYRNELENWLQENQMVLRSVRSEVNESFAWTPSLAGRTFFSPPVRTNFGDLTRLIAVDSRTRLGGGDLAGAWDDIVILFRLANGLRGPVPMEFAFQGHDTERLALGLAMHWAADPRQTIEGLRRAAELYRGLRPPFGLMETVRAQATVASQTLELPRSRLTEELTLWRNSPGRVDARAAALAALETTPWEVARARRVFSILLNAAVYEASTTPDFRTRRHARMGVWATANLPGIGPRSGAALYHDQETTPLVRNLFPPLMELFERNDRNEVGRRALILILALRSWQVGHGGSLPARLADLIPSELEKLPRDPYQSNRPFGYLPSFGQPLLPLGDFDPHPASIEPMGLEPTQGCALLYSIGPDRTDNRAASNDTMGGGPGDIVFPLPGPISEPPPNSARSREEDRKVPLE